MRLGDIGKELRATRNKFPDRWVSPHQGYAIILEEVDELWDEIRKKSEDRDPAKLRSEAIQIAAMSVRFIEDLLDEMGQTP